MHFLKKSARKKCQKKVPEKHSKRSTNQQSETIVGFVYKRKYPLLQDYDLSICTFLKRYRKLIMIRKTDDFASDNIWFQITRRRGLNHGTNQKRED